MVAAKLVATCFGIGYLQKGAGTVAALFCCLIWWLCRIDAVSWPLQLLLIAAIFIAGVWASAMVEKEWGHDSNRVVIDEVSGMSIGLFLLPHSWIYIILSFVIFRALDITKPLAIRRMEALPSGWGVMMDDLLAGIYTIIILHFLLLTKLIPFA